MRCYYNKTEQIAVDAGVVWIGDPCYVLGDDASHRVKDWQDFCNKIGNDSVSTPLGERTGVCVSSGHGDGTYEVNIEQDQHGIVTRVVIDFMSSPDCWKDEDEEEDDDA